MVNNDGLDEIKAATKKIVEIFNTGDFSAVSLLFSSDYIDHRRPTWMKVNGSEEFKQIVTLARKSLPNLKVSIKDLIAENDKVAVRLHWYSINSIGKKVMRETIHILRFTNSQAVEHWGAEAWRCHAETCVKENAILPLFWFSRRLADGTRGQSQAPHLSSGM